LVNRIEFGGFAADLNSGELSHNGQPVKIQRKTFQLLELLLESQGEALTRQRLYDLLWPGVYADIEHGLNTQVLKLRHLIGKASVETTPRGYRLARGIVVEFIDA
jgi:DNA-binding winged helix-turn-helix (wHTH) protein